MSVARSYTACRSSGKTSICLPRVTSFWTYSSLARPVLLDGGEGRRSLEQGHELLHRLFPGGAHLIRELGGRDSVVLVVGPATVDEVWP